PGSSRFRTLACYLQPHHLSHYSSASTVAYLSFSEVLKRSALAPLPMVLAKLTWHCCRITTRPMFLISSPSVDNWFMPSADSHSEGRKSLGIIAGCAMSDKQANQCGSVAKLHPVST